eukprot:1607108-Ditylum_brightwellii.AAC.1
MCSRLVSYNVMPYGSNPIGRQDTPTFCMECPKARRKRCFKKGHTCQVTKRTKTKFGHLPVKENNL